MKRKRTDFEDDGHVIAPMDVDGMPSGMLEQAGWLGKAYPKRKPKPEKPHEGQTPPAAEPTPAETRSAIGGALLAALLVAGVFLVAGALFIAFCTNVWLR